MTTLAYHRDVLALLRDDYGVTDAYVGHGGNHPQITFTYDDKPRHITLNNKAFSPRAFDMKRQDIRRLLGDPPPRAARERRTMEEMMPEPLIARGIDLENVGTSRAVPSIVAQGKMAFYADRLRMVVPPEVTAAFGATPIGVNIKMIDGESWEMTRSDAKRPALRYSEAGRRYEIDCLDVAARDVGALPSGLSPAEYLVDGGVILVRCPLATRVPLAQNRRPCVARTVVEAIPLRPVGPQVQELLAMFAAEDKATLSAPGVDDLRACLAALRRIEATTPYRLLRVKETGAWCFSAPRIE